MSGARRIDLHGSPALRWVMPTDVPTVGLEMTPEDLITLVDMMSPHQRARLAALLENSPVSA